MQVLSVNLPDTLEATSIWAGLSQALPSDIGLAAALPASKAFHAQFSAEGKVYRYRIAPGEPSPDPRWTQYCWRLAHPFSLERFREALSCCVGTHDFIALHGKTSARRLRTVKSIEVTQAPSGLVDVRVVGNAFGRYQVRYLVGAAAQIAAGERTVDDLREALATGTEMGFWRAPASGLVLWEVLYPRGLDPFCAQARDAAQALPAMNEAPFSER
jgi:tRNA pseudouridine38-40 synthase